MERKQIIEEIAQQMALIKRRLVEATHFSKDISPAQYGVLHILTEHDAQSSKDLAARLAITPGAITQLVDPLVDKGVLKRVPSDEDRRVVNLCVTKKGERELCVLKEHSLTALTEVFAALSDEELKTLESLISKIRLEA